MRRFLQNLFLGIMATAMTLPAFAALEAGDASPPMAGLCWTVSCRRLAGLAEGPLGCFHVLRAARYANTAKRSFINC